MVSEVWDTLYISGNVCAHARGLPGSSGKRGQTSFLKQKRTRIDANNLPCSRFQGVFKSFHIITIIIT